MTSEDPDLAAALATLTPSARDHLRRALVMDHPDRDAIAQELLRFGDQNSRNWADVIGALTMDPDARRRVARMIAEMDAAE